MFSKVDNDALIAALPSLKAFAINLTRNATRAEDLVQETVLRAYANAKSFQSGTNMAAWLFVILRNLFRSEYRKRRREVEDPDGSYEKSLWINPSQERSIEFQETRDAMKRLPRDQYDALALVGVSGFSYEEAALVTGTAIGTVKSRLNRARERLAELLGENRTPLRIYGALQFKKSPPKRLPRLAEPTPTPVHGVVRVIPRNSPVWAETEQRLKPLKIQETQLVEVRSATPQQTQQADIEAFGTMFTLHKVIKLPDGQLQKIYRAA